MGADWVLIIWIASWAGGSYGRPVAIEHVPGFSSEISCNSAAIKLTNENLKQKGPGLFTICVRQ